jgi:hypothetical protein
MPKPRRWRKEFPYYKVQVFDEIVESWKDERKTFETVEAAHEYIAKVILLPAARVVVVESTGRHVLDS